jgi:hypothetical protein
VIRRFFAAILLIAIAVQLGGTWMIHYWQEREIKAWQTERIAKGKYADKDLSYLEIPEAVVQWEDKEEFVHEGYMYDLVSMYEQNGILHITALKDHKETDNNRSFHEQQKEDAKGSTGKQILRASVTPFLIPAHTKFISFEAHIVLPALPIKYLDADPALHIIVPPPRA